MAKLSDMRAALVGRVMEGNPTQEFPFPMKVVDYEIFNAAGNALRDEARAKNSPIHVEGWMITRFECLSSTLYEPMCFTKKCMSQYYITLPFEPLELSYGQGIANVIVPNAGWMSLSYVPFSMISMVDGMENPPSYAHPAYTFNGDRLYMMGGERDFSKCNVIVEGVVGSLTEAANCSDDANVPVPEARRGYVLDLAFTALMQSLKGGEEDTAEDTHNTDTDVDNG